MALDPICPRTRNRILIAARAPHTVRCFKQVEANPRTGRLACRMWPPWLRLRPTVLDRRRDKPVDQAGNSRRSERPAPLYVAGMAMWAGWTVFYSSVVGLVSMLAFWSGRIFLAVPYEECRRQARFDDSYAQYKRTVPRWLPTLGGSLFD